MSSNTDPKLSRWIVPAAVVVAVCGALPYAGSWNDGSRLASVEALVDRHTWAIDDSIFVKVPENADQRPYPDSPNGDLLMRLGTFDKLSIAGKYYSDKSPVPALFLAGEYGLVQAVTGWTARDQTHWFCWLLTLGSSGLAYVVSVWCMERLGLALRLEWRPRLLLTVSFALATVALAYSRQVNNHILLLAVAMALFVEMAWLLRGAYYQTTSRLLGIGCLAGLAYCIDLGAGPLLTALTGLAILARCRSFRSCLLYALAAAPLVILHQGLNHAIGGTWTPANANPEYLAWPGSPFTAQTMTGGWHHQSLGHFVLYALDLLVGKKGFLLHNLPVLLSLGVVGLLLRRIRPRENLECCLALSWAVSVWLIYAFCSTNASGVCCSIRWFVPLLAPCYFLLAILVREYPALRADLLLLTCWGSLLGAIMAWNGPWYGFVQAGFWYIVAGAAVSWAWLARLRLIAGQGIAEPFALRLLDQPGDGRVPDTKTKAA